MKRIYVTAVPLESNFLLTPRRAEPVNFNLNHTPAPAAFPIVPVLRDTVREGDSVKVIAVRQKNAPENRNMDLLRQELNGLRLPDCTLCDISVAETQEKDALLALFGALIDAFEEEACYYACITFGTKTYPLVLFSALRCAEKLMRDIEVKGIYYREITRREGREDSARLYDVSALFTLDSIADLAAGGFSGSAREFVHLLLDPSCDGGGGRNGSGPAPAGH